MEIARTSGSRKLRCCLLANFGLSQKLNQDFPSALQTYQQGLELAQKVGDTRMKGIMLFHLGSFYRDYNDWKNAKKKL